MQESVAKHATVCVRGVSDGPFRSHLEVLTKRLGLRHAVPFLGERAQPDVIYTLEAAHLFLAPSILAADGDQDAPVNTLTEAMATGLTVISTWHGAIPQPIEDGVSGLLVPERDVQALAGALRQLVAAPERWAAMGGAGRKRVQVEYDRRKLNDRLDGIYRDVFSSAAGPLQEGGRTQLLPADWTAPEPAGRH